MRARAVGPGLVLAVCLLIPIAPAGAAPDPVTPRLTVAPDATVAGQVTGQTPAAGELVPLGAAIGIDLATDEPDTFPLLPAAAGGGGLLLLLLAVTPLTVHRRRLRRERRWLDGDVEVTPGARVPLPGAALPGSAPGLDVRIEVHRHRWPPTPGGPAP